MCQKDPSETKEEDQGQSSEVSSPVHRRLWLLGHLQLQASECTSCILNHHRVCAFQYHNVSWGSCRQSGVCGA